MRLGAARFVAGETLEDCLGVVRRLNAEGLAASVTPLGEGVSDDAGATAAVATYAHILGRIAEERLDANVGLKLTNVGLAFDEATALANAARIARLAAAVPALMRIDMEESTTVDATLRVYRALRVEGHDNLEIALQAYLYRCADDLAALLPLRPVVRLVKGAYLEAPSVAYPRKRDVDANYVRLVEEALRGGACVAVATHDERIVEHAIRYAFRHDVPFDRLQFQMLYGVRHELQRDLARRGFRVLVSVPYGPEWYAYFMRRLAERPANLLFLLRNVVRA